MVGVAAVAGISACSSSEATKPAAAEADLDKTEADDVLPSETQDSRPVPGPPLITGSFVSTKMLGRTTRWAVARPNGVTGKLPVVVVLHGLGRTVERLREHGVKRLGVGGQGRTCRRPTEQRNAEFLRQRRDLPADRAGRHVQFGRGAMHAAMAGWRLEVVFMEEAP